METCDISCIALSLGITIVLIFGSVALYYSQKIKKSQQVDTEFFLTARNSQSALAIAWSFYSTTVGAWVLFVPSEYTTDPKYGAGILGLFWYSAFNGLPILLVAWLGSKLRDRYPTIMSIGDFAHLRYGRIMELYVTLLVIFNLGVALSVEYTTIGGLYSRFYNINRIIPISVVFVVTMIYTSIGGVYVSIVTDAWQAKFSLLLSCIAIAYVAATYRPTDLPPLPPYLAINERGIGSFLSNGLPFLSTAVFNDAYWQRVWSSENDASLKKGSVLAFILISFIVFTFGFFGFLASWAGYSDNPETAFFSLLHTDTWMLILVTMLAVAMNESLVDSYQNGLADCASTLFVSLGLPISINVARVITIMINIPIVFIGLQGFDANCLFLIGNYATTLSCLPIVLGLFPLFDEYIHQGTSLFGCLFSILSMITFQFIRQGDLLDGIRKLGDSYEWNVFLIAFSSSGVGMFIFCVIEMCICKKRYAKTHIEKEPKESLLSYVASPPKSLSTA